MKSIDIEITVNGTQTQYGFEGKTISNEEVVIVFSKNTSKIHTHVENGQKLRILTTLQNENELIIKPRTEIYYKKLLPDKTESVVE